MTACDRIVERMKELRINQKQLSDLLEVAPSTVHTWLFRTCDFPASYAPAIASALKVTTDWLLTGSNPPNAEIPADLVRLSDPERFVVDSMRQLGYEGSIVIQNTVISELRRLRDLQGMGESETAVS